MIYNPKIPNTCIFIGKMERTKSRTMKTEGSWMMRGPGGLEKGTSEPITDLLSSFIDKYIRNITDLR